jgi:hypothetical protein
MDENAHQDQNLWGSIIIMVVTEPTGEVKALHWFDEGNFERTKILAMNRAIDWCVARKIDVDFLDRKPLHPTDPGDWRMLVAAGPPFRVELWGSTKTL